MGTTPFGRVPRPRPKWTDGRGGTAVAGGRSALVSLDRSGPGRRHAGHRQQPVSTGPPRSSGVPGRARRCSTSAPGTASSRSNASGAAPRGSSRRITTRGTAPAGARKPGFELARQALGSRVEDVDIDVMDLSPERIGTVRRGAVSRRALSPPPSAPGPRAGRLGRPRPADPRDRRRHGRRQPPGDGVLSGPGAEQRSDELVGAQHPGRPRHAEQRGVPTASAP